MDKEQAKKEKKRIKELQKEKKKKDKVKQQSKKDITIEELETVDLVKARKESCEKAYTLHLVKEIIKVCNDAINQSKEDNKIEKINLLLKDLLEISDNESWYYTEKIKEFTLNKQEIENNKIILSTDRRYIKNVDNYVLNKVERNLLSIQVNTLLVRAKGNNTWSKRQWKFARADAEVLFFMIRDGIKENQIRKIKVSVNELDRVTKIDISYGGEYTGTINLLNINWEWNKYDEDGNLLHSEPDLSYIIYPSS